MSQKITMAGFKPATQPASVSERKESLRPQTRARWVAASSPAMVINFDGGWA
jgi:hypothetical protein